MSLLKMVIIAALLITIGMMITGIWSMQHGGESDQRRSTQLMAGRVGMQAVTFLLLMFAVYLAN